MATFEQVPDPNVKLLSFVQIIPRKILRTEKRYELSISIKGRIRAQVRGNLLGLILKNQSSRSFDRMVVRQRQIDGLIKSDQRRILPTACRR